MQKTKNDGYYASSEGDYVKCNRIICWSCSDYVALICAELCLCKLSHIWIVGIYLFQLLSVHENSVQCLATTTWEFGRKIIMSDLIVIDVIRTTRLKLHGHSASSQSSSDSTVHLALLPMFVGIAHVLVAQDILLGHWNNDRSRRGIYWSCGRHWPVHSCEDLWNNH